MASSTTLNILILSDGLPGHVNQSRGLVSWLSNRYHCEVREVDVALRLRPVARILLPRLLHGRAPGASVTSCFYRKNATLLPVPDLLVSAGGNTSFLNAALARKWQVPNVFLGSKRRLRSDDFAAHLTLEPTGEPHNIVMALAPTLIDPERLQHQGAELRRELGLAPDKKLNMVAIGGDGAGFHYDQESIHQLVQLIVREHERTGACWLLTTSRRTGRGVEQQLQKAIPSEVLADSVWWSEAPRKVMSAYMGAADQLFVTADSMSMIAEAIASEKPTVVLQPGNARPDERYLNALKRYERSGLCTLTVLGQPLKAAPVRAGALAEAKDALLDRLVAQLGL